MEVAVKGITKKIIALNKHQATEYWERDALQVNQEALQQLCFTKYAPHLDQNTLVDSVPNKFIGNAVKIEETIWKQGGKEVSVIS